METQTRNSCDSLLFGFTYVAVVEHLAGLTELGACCSLLLEGAGLT